MDGSALSYTAMYPYSAARQCDDDLDYVIPNQAIEAGKIADPAALISRTELVPVGTSLQFRNQVALLQFTVEAAGQVAFMGGFNGRDSQALTVSCPAAGTYYAAVCPGDFEGMKVLVGNRLKQSANPISTYSNQIINIGKVDNGQEVTPIWNSADLSTFLANPQHVGYVMADIDATEGITPVATFSGVLEGQDCYIKNWKSAKGLVATNNGTIRNLKIDESCSFTPAAEDFAPFVTVNNGTLEHLGNNGSIIVSDVHASSAENIAIAGIAARSEKDITDCTNNGSIKYEADNGAKGLFIGGVVAMTKAGIAKCTNSADITYTVNGDGGYKSTLFGGLAGYCAGKVTNCNNSGDLGMNAKYIAELVPMEIYDAAESSCYASLMMGGVVGAGAPKSASTSDFSMEDCSNNGAISFAITDPMATGCATTNSRHCVGGLVGDGSGPIVGTSAGSSYNSGRIDVSLTCAAGSFTYGGATLTTYIGGIAGSGYTYKAQTGMNIVNCENEGTINYIDHNTHTTTHTVGGIVGWPGKESGCASVTSGCVNRGTININSQAELRAAGIQGGSGKVEVCTNYGNINVTRTTATGQIGGICGFHSGGYLLSEVKNFGNITCDFAVTSGGVGGIAGKFGNSAMTLCANSAVDCNLTVADGCSAGLVIGGFNGGTKTITCGNIAVKGSFNGTTLTESNYRDYLHGSYNYTEGKHIINATYGDAPEPPHATIKVMSFNIRHTGEASDTGEKDWEVRKTAVLNMILQEMPDIIGVQECDKTQKDWLMSQIEGDGHAYYQHVYPAGNKCIFYKLATMGYTSGTSGLFYHSDTPEKSSMWEGMTSARVTAWIPLVEKTTGRQIYFFNTHTDASSGAIHDQIRIREAELNVSQCKKISSPSSVQIICGDMNTAAPEAHAPFSPYFVSSRTAPETDNYPTFHGWGKYDLTNAEYLDYIYVHNAAKLIRHRTLIGENYGVKYISDHWPVVLELEIK